MGVCVHVHACVRTCGYRCIGEMYVYRMECRFENVLKRLKFLMPYLEVI
jgi:hypothetical protein